MRTKLLLQIHDELLFETPAGELDDAKEIVSEEMRSALPLKVPVEVNLGTGKNWREV
jgi:DNA polymerase-1